MYSVCKITPRDRKRELSFQKSNSLITAEMVGEIGKLSKNAFLFWSILMRDLQKKIKGHYRSEGRLEELQELELRDSFLCSEIFAPFQVVEISYRDFADFLKPHFPPTICANSEIRRIINNLYGISMRLISPTKDGKYRDELFRLIEGRIFEDEREVLTIKISSIYLYHLITKNAYTNIQLDYLSLFRTLYASFLYEFFEKERGRGAYQRERQGQTYIDFDGDSDKKKKYDGGFEIPLDVFKDILKIPKKVIILDGNTKKAKENKLYKIPSIGLFLDRIRFKNIVLPDLKEIYPNLEYKTSRSNNSIIFFGFNKKEEISVIEARRKEMPLAQRKEMSLAKLEA